MFQSERLFPTGEATLSAQGEHPLARLAATGFAEHHPLDPADSPAAYARNRRVEIKLTQP